MASPGDTVPIAAQHADVIIIGSGIGGLSAACLAATYGMRVTVVESHEHAGGAAHSFTRGGFVFDSGPSLWSGMAAPSVNPLRQVLDAVEENVEWCRYDGWEMVLPQGSFYFKVGDAPSWKETLKRFGGPDAEEQWERFIEFARPVVAASGATPPMALRSDPWAIVSLCRCLPGFLSAAPYANFLNGRLSLLMERAGLTDPFLTAWLDYLAFALSGLDSKGTLGAAVAFTIGDLYRPQVLLDYPLGGSGAVIEALVRGLEKKGGTLRTRAHVEQILIDEGGRANGVQLKRGEQLFARVAVISNADVWSTVKLLPAQWRPPPRLGRGGALNSGLEMTPTFMHLHLGFKGGNLPAGLGIHYSVVLDSFEDILRERNMVIISIPTLLDPSLAPDGQHVLHAYLAADEPYEPWDGLDRRSDEYKRLKQERANVLWAAVEKIIPDIRERVVVEMVGTPLTHERFLRRTRGTYGPAVFAGANGGTIPFAKTQIKGLLHCGDSCFPGIGVPAAAASGMNAANTLATPWQQLELMNWLDKRGCLQPKPSSAL